MGAPVNTYGLTAVQWLYAAGYLPTDRLVTIPESTLASWRNGEDPADWRIKPMSERYAGYEITPADVGEEWGK